MDATTPCSFEVKLLPKPFKRLPKEMPAASEALTSVVLSAGVFVDLPAVESCSVEDMLASREGSSGVAGTTSFFSDLVEACAPGATLVTAAFLSA